MTIASIGERTGATFAGENDLNLLEANPTNNSDGFSVMFVYSATAGQRRRGLMRFNGLSNIASGQTVNSVTLQIYSALSTSAVNVRLHKVLSSWTDSQVCWDLRSTGVSWASNGGLNSTDVDMTPIATVAVSTTNDTVYNITGNSALNALVEGWINGTIPNYGLLLVRDTDTAYDGVLTQMWGGLEANFAPLLTVDYSAAPSGPTVTTVATPGTTEAGSMVFTATLSGATSGSTNYAFTLGGTATAGTDYTSPLTSAMCSNGVTVVGSDFVVPTAVSGWTVTIPTTSDTIDEANETIILTIGGTASTGGTINDDDAAPVITVGDAPSVTAGSPAVFTISLDRAKSSAITVDAACVDGTLVGGVGYTSNLASATISNGVTFGAGALTIPAGVTSFTVSIPTTP